MKKQQFCKTDNFLGKTYRIYKKKQFSNLKKYILKCFVEKASRLYCGLSCKINHYPHDGHQTLPQKQEQTTKAEDDEEEKR